MASRRCSTSRRCHGAKRNRGELDSEGSPVTSAVASANEEHRSSLLNTRAERLPETEEIPREAVRDAADLALLSSVRSSWRRSLAVEELSNFGSSSTDHLATSSAPAVEEVPLFPLLLEKVAAVFKKAKCSSGGACLLELKLARVEAGHPWTDQLERSMWLCCPGK